MLYWKFKESSPAFLGSQSALPFFVNVAHFFQRPLSRAAHGGDLVEATREGLRLGGQLEGPPKLMGMCIDQAAGLCETMTRRATGDQSA
jgi:hypothetical protein